MDLILSKQQRIYNNSDFRLNVASNCTNIRIFLCMDADQIVDLDLWKACVSIFVKKAFGADPVNQSLFVNKYNQAVSLNYAISNEYIDYIRVDFSEGGIGTEQVNVRVEVYN